MLEREANAPEEQLKELEKLAERLEPKKPSTWDVVGVVAIALVFLSIGLFFNRCGQPELTSPLTSTPPSTVTDYPTFVLLGRYNNAIYYFSELHGQVLRYDPVNGRSESVFDLSSYQAHLWSPHGNKIAIISNQDNDRGDLYVVDLSNPIKNPAPLSQRGESTIPKSFALLATSPMAWSPDESAVAFIAYDNDISDIFAAKFDGTGTWRVTTNQKNLSSIVWADDDTIAFVMRENAQYKKFLIKTDSSGWKEWR